MGDLMQREHPKIRVFFVVIFMYYCCLICCAVLYFFHFFMCFRLEFSLLFLPFWFDFMFLTYILKFILSSVVYLLFWFCEKDLFFSSFKSDQYIKISLPRRIFINWNTEAYFTNGPDAAASIALTLSINMILCFKKRALQRKKGFCMTVA